MQLDELVHQGQPDARALLRPTPRALDPVESLEQPGQLVPWDPRARVRDAQLHCVPAAVQPDLDPALEGELEGIGEQVEDDLLPSPDRRAPALERSAIDAIRARHARWRAEDAREIAVSAPKIARLEGRLHAAIREKSSRAFRQRASAVRCAGRARAFRLRGAQGAVRAEQRVLQRREHQRGGVRSSWLALLKKAVLARPARPGLGARALFVGRGVADGRGDVLGDQLEEAR
jgi:hypothetical protein